MGLMPSGPITHRERGQSDQTIHTAESRRSHGRDSATSFDPDRIAERYWEVVHVDGPWQAEFRFTGE
jgi:hypothetical protein